MHAPEQHTGTHDGRPVKGVEARCWRGWWGCCSRRAPRTRCRGSRQGHARTQSHSHTCREITGSQQEHSPTATYTFTHSRTVTQPQSHAQITTVITTQHTHKGRVPATTTGLFHTQHHRDRRRLSDTTQRGPRSQHTRAFNPTWTTGQQAKRRRGYGGEGGATTDKKKDRERNAPPAAPAEPPPPPCMALVRISDASWTTGMPKAPVFPLPVSAACGTRS